MAPQIRARGEADVLIGGRTFRLGRGFLHDIGGQPQAYRIAHLGAALLVLHSPQDTVVGVDNARGIYQAARHPKSFISLDGADHLLADPADAGYVADVITAWAARYLPPRTAVIDPVATDPIPARAVDVAWSGIGRYRQAVRTGTHDWVVDEPVSVGGDDAGPNPYDQLLAALGACTSITLRMYADRKGWPLHHVSVRLRHDRIHAKDCADCSISTGTLTRIRQDIRLDGALTAEQRQALMSIADRCPVHQVLRSETVIDTHAVDRSPPRSPPDPATGRLGRRARQTVGGKVRKWCVDQRGGRGRALRWLRRRRRRWVWRRSRGCFRLAWRLWSSVAGVGFRPRPNVSAASVAVGAMSSRRWLP